MKTKSKKITCVPVLPGMIPLGDPRNDPEAKFLKIKMRTFEELVKIVDKNNKKKDFWADQYKGLTKEEKVYYKVVKPYYEKYVSAFNEFERKKKINYGIKGIDIFGEPYF